MSICPCRYPAIQSAWCVTIGFLPAASACSQKPDVQESGGPRQVQSMQTGSYTSWLKSLHTWAPTRMPAKTMLPPNPPPPPPPMHAPPSSTQASRDGLGNSQQYTCLVYLQQEGRRQSINANQPEQHSHASHHKKHLRDDGLQEVRQQHPM